MEKTLVIDGKEVRFKSTAATPLRYKAQFRKDFFSEILKLASLQNIQELDVNNLDTDDLDDLDFEVLYRVTWVLAKTADPSIPELLTWLDGFEEFPLDEILPEIMEMVTLSLAKKK